MVTGFIKYNNFTYYCDPSSGAMATGWTLINGYYYFFQTNNDYNLKGRMIKGEVNLNGVTYYLDDNSGRMLTNIWKQMKPIYDGRPRYGYFASSGYMATDSDVPGCADGYNVYSHGTPLRSVDKLRYEISLGTIVWIDNSKVTSNIKAGMRQWENTTESWFTQTQSVDEADIMFRLFDFEAYYGDDNI